MIDTAFITGMSAFVSAMLIFVGSAFLLLAIIMGARLAYFVTASITLAFTLIMGIVWSINPLGPLGQLPEWDPIDAQEDAATLEFDAAAEYPDDPWEVPDTEDAQQTTQASELESDATDYVSAQVAEERIEGFPPTAQFAVEADSTRLLTRGDRMYGMTTIDVLPPIVEPELGIPSRAQRERDAEAAQEEATGAEEIEPLGQVAVVAEYDPGNPLGLARMITLGTLILFILHLFGLSMAERRVRRERVEEAPA
ncbi:MAG: hypothetical protein KY391_05315 [Actinobacteria bacterium]|nr:hypothetical protein [Actinomycetota bacterium]